MPRRYFHQCCPPSRTRTPTPPSRPPAPAPRGYRPATAFQYPALCGPEKTDLEFKMRCHKYYEPDTPIDAYISAHIHDNISAEVRSLKLKT